MKRQSPPLFLNDRGYINVGNKCRLMWSPLTMMQSLVISYVPPDLYLPMQIEGRRPWRCSQVYFCPAEEEQGLPPFVDPFLCPKLLVCFISGFSKHLRNEFASDSRHRLVVLARLRKWTYDPQQ